MKKGTFGQANQESPDSQLYHQPSIVIEDYNYRTPPTSAFGQKKQVPCATIQLPTAKQLKSKQEDKEDLHTHRVIDEIEKLEIEHYLN